jgi:hypothetical protein
MLIEGNTEQAQIIIPAQDYVIDGRYDAGREPPRFRK